MGPLPAPRRCRPADSNRCYCPGVGLGLAIVQRHGGDIWATSDGQTGAQFMFTLTGD